MSLQELCTKIKQSSYVKSIAVLMGGAFFAQVIAVLSAPIVARLYSPSDMGTMSLVSNFVTFGIVFSSLQLPAAIVGAESERDALSLTLTSFTLSMVVSLLLVLIEYGLYKFSVFGFGYLPLWAILASYPILVFAAFGGTLRFFCIRKQQFPVISKVSITQTLGRVVGQIGLSWPVGGVAALLASDGLSRLIGMRAMLRGTGLIDSIKMQPAQASLFSMGTLKKYKKYPLIVLPSSVIDNSTSLILLPVFIQIYGLDIGGQLSMAQRMILAPLSVITASVADAFQGRLGSLSRETPTKIRSLIFSTAFALLMIGLVPAIVLFFWGEPLFMFVFGTKWALAGRFSSIIIFWLIANFVVSPISRVVFVLGGQEKKMVYDVIAFLFMMGSLIISQYVKLTPYDSLKLITGSQIFSYIIYLVLLLKIVNDYLRKTGVIGLQEY